MKSWFAKFRISNALNTGTLPSRRSKLAASTELRRYADAQAALDDALKRTAPKPAPLPGLHASIMRAVRAANQEPAPREAGIGWRWLTPAAITAVAMLGVFLILRRPNPADIPPIVRALENGQGLAQSIPSVTTPLSDEFARLNTDLSRTEQFLLAKFPSGDGVQEMLNR
jgi:hypothetical protein